MEPVLLSLHVLAAIVFVGGSAVASSLFPRYAPTRDPSFTPRPAPTPETTPTPRPAVVSNATPTPRPTATPNATLTMQAAAGAEAALTPHPAPGAEATGEQNASSATGTDFSSDSDLTGNSGSTGSTGSTGRPITERNPAVAAVLHRITGGYAAFGLIVPVVGIVLAAVQGRMGEVWITISMVLTAAAGLLLATQIHPRQRQALDTPGDVGRLRTLSMLAGIYNLLWAVVVVLMIVRPGGQAGV